MGIEVTMGEALIVTLVSMLVVFLVLILISYIIGLLKNFAAGKKPVAVKPEQANAAVIKQEVEAPPSTPELDERELIAVIAAAVAASLGRDIPEIRINSIRRVPQLTTPWREMGKQEQLLSKL